MTTKKSFELADISFVLRSGRRTAIRACRMFLLQSMPRGQSLFPFRGKFVAGLCAKREARREGGGVPRSRERCLGLLQRHRHICACSCYVILGYGRTLGSVACSFNGAAAVAVELNAGLSVGSGSRGDRQGGTGYGHGPRASPAQRTTRASIAGMKEGWGAGAEARMKPWLWMWLWQRLWMQWRRRHGRQRGCSGSGASK
ncbi:hypothetical protein BC939DRAFT_467594 [Gamsiella multidivaricata]|uniref:uncharacterized protein n=1 Tax=Gamsiella multidivaricata TaxID=101098 RepID=UPI00221F2C2F|nr:uncharacterized protein BC939DRAFT_467594 [Gamsiella multidivaricata]KAI7816861.1 hypothetical protein BC939DRAFT_467594 [Gamsiella multidivaricata]